MKKYNHPLPLLFLLLMLLISCTDAISDELEDPSCVSSDLAISIEIENGGHLRAVGSGGSAPYSFIWNNGSLDPIVLNPSKGEYIVQVKDANGCIRTDKITVSADNQVADGSVVGNIKDVDGNTYPTVKIGTQVWAQKNLNVSHYRNGDPIPEVRNPDKWMALRTGAWCYYENNSANGSSRGKLYNWYAVTDPRGLVPEGYHVPDFDEWEALIDYWGGFEVAGPKLKSTQNWPNSNFPGTNESGFTAVPGGYRHTQDVPAAIFNEENTYALFWSSTDLYPDYNGSVWSHAVFLRASTEHARGIGLLKTNGHSIRFVKD